jgi:hypothetical protein
VDRLAPKMYARQSFDTAVYGLDSHLVAVSRRPGTDSGAPGSIAGQTMDTVALLWYPRAVEL